MSTKLKNSVRGIVLGCVAGCVVAAVPHAANADGPTSRPARHAFAWTPPTDGAPSNLSSATARSACEADQNLGASVLAPNAYVGTTTQESPVLYWYTTKPTIMKIRVTMVRDNDLNNPSPLFNVVYRDPLAAGIQSIDLSSPLAVMDADDKPIGEAHPIKLEENVKYRWSVHLCSPDGASQDVVSEAIIMRVKPEASLTAALGAAGDDYEKANAYAKAHVWYDMLASLSTLIDKNPADPMLRAQRTKLLSAEKLPLLSDKLKTWAVPPGA